MVPTCPSKPRSSPGPGNKPAWAFALCSLVVSGALGCGQEEQFNRGVLLLAFIINGGALALAVMFVGLGICLGRLARYGGFHRGVAIGYGVLLVAMSMAPAAMAATLASELESMWIVLACVVMTLGLLATGVYDIVGGFRASSNRSSG